tara:strand:- start:7871 stop:8218 length:348 start_codon:yes stop_codon:yes gene_type:complete
MPEDNLLYSMGRDVRFSQGTRKDIVGFYFLRLQKNLAELPTGFKHRTLNQNRSGQALILLFSWFTGTRPPDRAFIGISFANDWPDDLDLGSGAYVELIGGFYMGRWHYRLKKDGR